MAAGTADVLAMVRKSIAATARNEDVQRPFRFLLCGDPFLVAEFRALLLRTVDHEDHVPLDAGATLETIDPLRRPTVIGPDARCVIFLARPGDLPGDVERPVRRAHRHDDVRPADQVGQVSRPGQPRCLGPRGRRLASPCW